MSRHRAGFRVFALLSGAVGVTMVFALSGVAALGDDASGGLDRFAPIDPSVYAPDGANTNFVPASLSDQSVEVVLEMSGDPVAVQDAAAQQSLGRKLTGAEKQAVRDHLQAQQDGLRGDLDRAGAQIVGQMQDAYNGIHLIVPESNLDQLASLPGVVAIHGVTTFTPDNVNGVPFIGGPTAWGFGATGKGVKVASIDTGIDYTHADFGGPGTVAAFTTAKANSTMPADPTLFGPTAPKVKGGFDFAGDAYNANDPNHRVPVPDPNPLDCNGHGSHTAGTMAGDGVLSTGATFAGPYDANTIKNNTWNVGPGVAPQADIYAYRVFGCSGSSAVVDLAINRAVKDGVDVISMSLGSPFGGTTDTTSVAAQNAFNDGITVVASAGNNGTNGYLVGSPSTATGVLSVAAIDGSVATYPGASLALSSGGTVNAIDANGAPVSAITLKVKVLKNADGSVSLGCNPAEYAGTTGMLVVTVRGTCARVARAIFGQQAGAAAVLMINSPGTTGLPPFEGKITSNPDTGQPFTVTIPFLGAAFSDTAALLAADGGTAALASTTVPNLNYRLAASFTSGGPRGTDSAPKPDVMAPGVSVSSVGMGTGTLPTVMSGTSMACPMTAGIAALVKQVHPTWHGAQIKAAIINTADPSILASNTYNVRVAGTGVVQAQKAVNSTVVASTTDGLDSIAFGYVQGTGDYNASKSFTLTNYGSTDATYNLSVATNGTQRGESVTVTPSTVTVAAATTQTVNVKLSITAATFAALPTDDILATNAAGFISGPGVVLTVRGNIVATPVAGDASSDQTLRLSYLIVARGLSAVASGTVGAFSNVSSISSTGAITPGHTIAANLSLSNSGIHDGTADLYAWGIHRDQTTGSSIDVRDVGLQVFQGGSKVPNDRGLVFAISNYGSAANQAKNEFDVVISVNGDTKPDFIVAGADIGAVLTGTSDGRYGSFTINLKTGKIVGFLADAPMNGSVIELRTQASLLGLAQKASGIGDVKNEGITYRVNAFDLRTGAVVRTGSTTFNPFSPSVSSGNFATVAAGGGSSHFTLAVDTDQQFAEPALGWLVASLDNASGPAQVGEVPAPPH